MKNSELVEAVTAKLASGEWWFVDGQETILVTEPETTWHADDGNAELVFTGCDNSRQAAQKYADGGDWWGDSPEGTIWVKVYVWREGIDINGDVVKIDEETHKISIDPEEPKCVKAEHDYQTPHELLGGLHDNPGVFGHGGGVIFHEVCMNCGTEKITDSWAQDPDDGQQGLDSVEYKAYRFRDEIAKLSDEQDSDEDNA